MNLLCFAHLGEAQSFIKYFKLKMSGDQFYTGKTFDLVITKEGLYPSLAKVSSLLAITKYKYVINYGIAGALKETAKVDEIYSVRTVYAHNLSRPEFHSFTSHDPIAKLDTISCTRRVLNNEDKSILKPFASIIDRELWAIAFACHQKKTPFFAYKLISDIAGEKTDCQDIKGKALDYSMKLLKHFLALEKRPNIPDEEIDESGFYFTVSQKRHFTKLLKQMNKKQDSREFMQSDIVTEIKNLDIPPKAKSKLLLLHIEKIISPMRFEINKTIENYASELKDQKIDISWDKKLDKSSLTFSFEVKDENEFSELSERLKQYSPKKIFKTLSGELEK